MARVSFQTESDWATNCRQLSPSTRSVQFGGDFSIKDEHVAEVASKCPNLLEFSAGSQDTGCGTRCTPAALISLTDNCPKLKNLHLWSFVNVDDAAAIYAVKRLTDLQELTITGHDKSSGKVTGRLLRSLAGYDEEYDSGMESATQDFRRRIKEAMREIINRERAKKGLQPLVPLPERTKGGDVNGRGTTAENRRNSGGNPGKHQDEDEEEYFDEDEDEDEEDAELEMLKEEGCQYFEVVDEGDLDADAGWMADIADLYGSKDQYEPDDLCKPGAYIIHDYAQDFYVQVEMHKPKHQAPSSFIAPKLRKLYLEDQNVSFSDIKKLKDARRSVQVFTGESCGSGYAAQMVYNMIGVPGQWH